MRNFWLVVLAGGFINLHAQTAMQSKDWIDLANKSDAEIARILEREVATLAESPADEANARVQVLQAAEKNAQQSFEQRRLLLEGELNAAAAARETAQKAFTNLQTDSTSLAAQIALYERTQQSLRERLDKFPFKAVAVAKAAYTGNLEPVKEKMIYEAGRLAIERVNGVKIISETLVKNNILVSDIIQATTEGKADCQPREWKTVEAGTRRVIYLYGIYDIYPLAEGTKLSGQAAQLQLAVEAHVIAGAGDAASANLPANVQQEILAMLATAEQINTDTRANLHALVQQQKQLIESSGITENKDVLKSKFETLKLQISAQRQELATRRQTFEIARRKFTEHVNGEQRIEITNQSDLERNRSQEVIKAQLMKECVTQFRTIVKSLYSQEKTTVKNFQLVENVSQSMMRQVRLQAAKVLGVYISSSEGDIKYTAAVAFRFGFDYTNAAPPLLANAAPVLTSNGGMEWILVRGGTFDIGDTFGEGSTDEKPVHRVTLGDFYLSKYEVTVAQFRQFCQSTGRQMPEQPEWNKGNHPMVNVTWDEARAFCEWAGGRLPTEAEWEYAARNGGKRIKYGTGKNTLSPRAANYDPGKYTEDGYRYAAPMGSFAPNALGLHDMAGNVWEWCADWYDENYYRNSPSTNPRGPSSGQRRVLRGGGWNSYPYHLRATYRGGDVPLYRDSYVVGFRCLQDVR